tara:strand:- start:67 stop:423 length:357 start_codon:yes stop_codon:yes gene_type:complete
MVIILEITIALLSLAVIAYPFLRSEKYKSIFEKLGTRDKILAERLRIYSKIHDLEAELSSGDLTNSEFLLMRDELRMSAAKLIKQESEPPISVSGNELEAEVARQREQSRHASEDRDL